IDEVRNLARVNPEGDTGRRHMHIPLRNYPIARHNRLLVQYDTVAEADSIVEWSLAVALSLCDGHVELQVSAVVEGLGVSISASNLHGCGLCGANVGAHAN